MKLIAWTFLICFSFRSYAARVVKCDDSKSIEISLKPLFATILNFPIKPDQVVTGSKSQISLEYIKNDLAITPLYPNSRTNLFVYLLGRRCGFTLIIREKSYDSLVIIKDPDESKMKVKFE